MIKTRFLAKVAGAIPARFEGLQGSRFLGTARESESANQASYPECDE
jgi:hypothetical protein